MKYALIGASLLLSAAAVAAEFAPAVAPPKGDVAKWVDEKAAACAPKSEERHFDRTGWLTEIRPALELAQRHNRPVFLFTHDGRIGLGRC